MQRRPSQKRPATAVDASACGTTREFLLAPRGSELSPLTTPKTPISQNERAESGAVDGEKHPKDPDLALIVERWPKLPEHVKATIMALVRMHEQE